VVNVRDDAEIPLELWVHVPVLCAARNKPLKWCLFPVSCSKAGLRGAFAPRPQNPRERPALQAADNVAMGAQTDCAKSQSWNN